MRSARLVVVALVVLLLAGIWTFVGPFALGLQPSFSTWNTATRNAMATGGALMVTALGALITYGILAVRQVLASAAQRVDEDRPATPDPRTSPLQAFHPGTLEAETKEPRLP